MNKLDLDRGRIKQKLKTREAILIAAQRLMKKSVKISLEDVALEAGISRATIYRYFSTIDLLILEASLDIQHLDPEKLANKLKTLPLEERIFEIQEYYNTLAQENEMGFRRYLSAALTESISSQKKVRGARRVDSLRKSLTPFKKNFSKEDFDRLIHISSILMGIDPLITAKDVCELDNEETSDLLRWALEMIMEGMKSTK